MLKIRNWVDPYDITPDDRLIGGPTDSNQQTIPFKLTCWESPKTRDFIKQNLGEAAYPSWALLASELSKILPVDWYCEL